MRGHPLSTTLGGGAGCDLPSRQGEPGPSFICQAAPLTARTARCRGRGAGPRGRARGCVPAVPAVGRLLAQISLREALRGGDGATAAGLAAPHPRCAPRQASRLGVCPTWDPLDSPEGPGECLRPGRLVLAGVLRSSCSRKRAPLRTSSQLLPPPPANAESPRGLGGRPRPLLFPAGTVGQGPPPPQLNSFTGGGCEGAVPFAGEARSGGGPAQSRGGRQRNPGPQAGWLSS